MTETVKCEGQITTDYIVYAPAAHALAKIPRCHPAPPSACRPATLRRPHSRPPPSREWRGLVVPVSCCVAGGDVAGEVKIASGVSGRGAAVVTAARVCVWCRPTFRSSARHSRLAALRPRAPLAATRTPCFPLA